MENLLRWGAQFRVASLKSDRMLWACSDQPERSRPALANHAVEAVKAEQEVVLGSVACAEQDYSSYRLT
jgi:hypothetical protein